MKSNIENETDDPVLSREETANYLGISPITLDQVVRRQGLKSFKIGRRVLFRKSWVDDWIEKKAEKKGVQNA